MKNTIDCANDLLARMMMKSDVDMQRIQNSVPKFQSAIVIQSMINGNHIIGHSNQEVYEMYSFVANEMNIPALSKIDLSRTLCMYYGFTLLDKKVDGKKVRVFWERTSDSKFYAEGMQSGIYYLTNVYNHEVLGCRNSEVYEQYVKWCMDNVQVTCSNITFSKLVCHIFNVEPKSVKRDGVTIRIYVEKDGADNADNSSSQESLR